MAVSHSSFERANETIVDWNAESPVKEDLRSAQNLDVVHQEVAENECLYSHRSPKGSEGLNPIEVVQHKITRFERQFRGTIERGFCDRCL
jgi:hypothetical protein